MIPILAIQAMGLRDGSGPELLTDIDLVLGPGQVAMLIGPVGAGKSLLLEVAAGLRRASRGSVRLFGGDAASPDREPGARAAMRRRIGFVEASPTPIGGMDAIDDVALPLRIAGVPGGEARRQAGELLAWLDVPRDRGAALTFAHWRRIGIARAIAGGAGLVLIDSLENDDPATLDRLARLIERLAQQGTAFLLASRDEASARIIPGTRRVPMAGGRLEVIDSGIAPPLHR